VHFFHVYYFHFRMSCVFSVITFGQITGKIIDVKMFFFVFLLKFKKTCFYVFIFYVFLCFFKCHVFVVVKTKTYSITNMMHFSWTKTPFPGQSECFVAVLLTLFDLY